MKSLSDLPKLVLWKGKRLGRGAGSGKGAKSGRGTTRHQTARENIPLHFEGGQGKITKKFPLLRGKGRNKSVRPRPVAIKLEVLNIFKTGEVINIESLIKVGLFDNNIKKTGVKIIGGGKLEKRLIVKLPVSVTVAKLIEKAGGKVEL